MLGLPALAVLTPSRTEQQEEEEAAAPSAHLNLDPPVLVVRLPGPVGVARLLGMRLHKLLIACVLARHVWEPSTSGTAPVRATV